jgi:hypothetical protein
MQVSRPHCVPPTRTHVDGLDIFAGDREWLGSMINMTHPSTPSSADREPASRPVAQIDAGAPAGAIVERRFIGE